MNASWPVCRVVVVCGLAACAWVCVPPPPVIPTGSGTANTPIPTATTPAGDTSGSGRKQSPVADAGPDRTVVDTDGNGFQLVTMDGSGSHDDDGEIVSYTWIASGSTLANTESPTLMLRVGVHLLDIVVTDNDGLTGTDTVEITVRAGS